MASRQMPPRERQEQEKWAQSQFRQLDTKCPAGYDWGRIPGGYRCQPLGPPPAGLHKVTDKLLAEGKGGVYCLKIGKREDPPEDWRGPFYVDPSKDEFVMYSPSGRLIRMDSL